MIFNINLKKTYKFIVQSHTEKYRVNNYSTHRLTVMGLLSSYI